jgi:hypothetical protein
VRKWRERERKRERKKGGLKNKNIKKKNRKKVESKVDVFMMKTGSSFVCIRNSRATLWNNKQALGPTNKKNYFFGADFFFIIHASLDRGSMVPFFLKKKQNKISYLRVYCK